MLPEGSGDEESPACAACQAMGFDIAVEGCYTMGITGREGMALRNYRRFLIHLEETLVEGLREAENAEWHHNKTGPLHNHYMRLCTWLDEVHDRIEHYDNTQASRARRIPKRASPSGGVVRHDHQRDDGVADAG